MDTLKHLFQKSLYSNYKDLLEDRVQLSFKGSFSQEVMTEFGTMIKSTLNAEHNTRRIFGVFVELAQNIILYSDDMENSNQGKIGIGIIVIQERLDTYFISSGNTIKSTDLDKFKLKCDTLNSMSKEELKIYYQEQIKKELPGDGSNIELGLVEVARKIDSKIDYIIDEIDVNKSYLTLNVAIKKN
ncbi:MAG: hypothetical protein EBS19_06535 [Spirochaetia bacterium]|nr:hypothetical protein [Spirochaetia bacterium]